jgi:hypothetical protein
VRMVRSTATGVTNRVSTEAPAADDAQQGSRTKVPDKEGWLAVNAEHSTSKEAASLFGAPPPSRCTGANTLGANVQKVCAFAAANANHRLPHAHATSSVVTSVGDIPTEPRKLPLATVKALIYVMSRRTT